MSGQTELFPPSLLDAWLAASPVWPQVRGWRHDVAVATKVARTYARVIERLRGPDGEVPWGDLIRAAAAHEDEGVFAMTRAAWRLEPLEVPDGLTTTDGVLELVARRVDRWLRAPQAWAAVELLAADLDRASRLDAAALRAHPARALAAIGGP